MLSRTLVKVAGFEKARRGPYYPRPSMAGPERCIRQTVYHALGIPEDKLPGDRAILTMDDSKWHEELTADLIRKTTIQISSQQMRVKGPYLPFLDIYIEGDIDGVLTDMLMVDRLLEHKALNHFGFQRYWAGKDPMDYITQSCIYCVGLQRVNPDIDEIVLLIKNKNTSQYIDYLIHYDIETDTASVIEIENSNGEIKRGTREKPVKVYNDVVKTALDIFAQVHEHAQDGTLPERPYEVGTDFPCSYCGWHETCWEGYEEEFEKLTDDKELEEEWEDLCRYYLEVAMHEERFKEEKDELKKQILETLKAYGVKGGRVGPYNVKIMQRKSNGQVTSEWVRITKPKQKEKRK